jgi:hypothetical protein
MLMRHLQLVLLSSVMLLSGCAAVHMREDTAEAPIYAPHAEYATQVAIGECAFTRAEESGFAAIGSALLANAVSAGINRIGTALTQAAQEKSLSAKASRNIEVTSNTFGPCVQIVRGWFYQDPFPLGTNDDPFAGNSKFVAAQGWFSPDFISREVFRTLWVRNQLWLAAPPDFLFEGRIMAASNNALTIAPQYVRLNEPLFTRTMRRNPSRHVAVFLAFHTPGTAVDATANPAATFVLGRLTPGKARIYPDPRSIAKFTPDSGVLNRWPHESDWFTLAVGKEKEPWVVSAAVTEQQDANEFLAFVAEVFGGAKETITAEVQNSIIPEKRAVAKETTMTAQETAATTLDQKQVGALTSLATCAQADAPTAQQASDARVALRGLNQAARGANREEPASQACLDKISITASSAAIKTACSDLLTTLAAGQTCK